MGIFKSTFWRLLVIAIAAVLQIGITIYAFVRFYSMAAWITTITTILSFLLVLYIINTSKHLSSDLIWILLILLAPISGTIIYLLFGATIALSKTHKAIIEASAEASVYYQQNQRVLNDLRKNLPGMYSQVSYIVNEGFPAYFNTGFDYYSLGEDGFPIMLKELKKAQKYIFIEYFIIEEGEMWNSILEILKEKAASGVDVRVMYDDVGSLFTLDSFYARQLNEYGISCLSFNRLNPINSIIVNHRDHRKIMVIDGKVAFSGGINLADEYINKKERFGVWKDNMIRITGEAVWSYTLMFLSHWNALNKQDTDYLSYKAEPLKHKRDGYIIPYADTPLDNELLGQSVYMNIINHANDYVYIMTPYLIIDTDMINALILAAKRGVDVKIITPGIPDKKIIYMITRSYYRTLIEGGVQIYEYTPGFLHAKVFVSDDICATVGTINLDYRSLYLHFENGSFLVNSQKVLEVRDDALKTLEASHEVTLKESIRNPLYSFIASTLRIFAPLM